MRGAASYRVSWEDLMRFVHEEQQDQQVYIAVNMHFTQATREGAYFEVRVSRFDTPESEITAVRTRVPCTPLREAGLPGQALHAVAQAMLRLRADPWLWAPEKRRQVVEGE